MKNNKTSLDLRFDFSTLSWERESDILSLTSIKKLQKNGFSCRDSLNESFRKLEESFHSFKREPLEALSTLRYASALGEFSSVSNNILEGKHAIVMPSQAVLVGIAFLLFILVKIFKDHHAVQYYTKFTFYCVCSTLTPLVLFPYFLLHPKNVLNFMWVAQNTENPRWQWITDRPVSALLKNVSRIIGIRFTVRGEEHLRKEETCVVVINHQSSLDFLGT